MAPSTPPPPSRDGFAALTIASAASVVMSPRCRVTRSTVPLWPFARGEYPRRRVAKAREIPELTTELPYGEVAARVLEVRTDELIEHSENVLDMADIERVHDMRVATRRLRAAIEVFRPCFPKGEGKRGAAARSRRWRTRSASGATATWRSTRSTASPRAMPAPDRPGIRSLIDRFAAEQERANAELGPFVDEARLAELRDRLLGLAAAAAGRGRRRRSPPSRRGRSRREGPQGQEARPARRRCARTPPGSSSSASTSCARSLPRRSTRRQSETQHDLRIAAKRLRYVLEATGFCFGRPAGDRAAAGQGRSRTCSARSTTAT